jgi:hypothetical protein
MRQVNFKLRGLTDDEVKELQQELGKPIAPGYLSWWISEAIRDIVRFSRIPTSRETRDDLSRISQDGRAWMDHIKRSPGASALLPGPTDAIRHAMDSFCVLVDAAAKHMDTAVKPGHPSAAFVQTAFLDRLIGIAKVAKVPPRSQGRKKRSRATRRRPPAFFRFAKRALDIAHVIIDSSPLDRVEKAHALKALGLETDHALSKAIERARGDISKYHVEDHGLSEWPAIERGMSSRAKPNSRNAARRQSGKRGRSG